MVGKGQGVVGYKSERRIRSKLSEEMGEGEGVSTDCFGLGPI